MLYKTEQTIIPHVTNLTQGQPVKEYDIVTLHTNYVVGCTAQHGKYLS